ncbi:MAG: hypothetical protein ACRC68_03675 [Clostridium sp.]
MILVTVSAIGSVSLLINKYLYPYKLDDSNKDLIKLYDDLITRMVLEVQNSFKGIKNKNILRNLFIRSSLIEEKINLNNQSLINTKNT